MKTAECDAITEQAQDLAVAESAAGLIPPVPEPGRSVVTASVRLDRKRPAA